jgi:hypothetical protein
VPPDSLQLSPWQSGDFKLFKEDRARIGIQEFRDEARNGTLAAAALTENDETILR